MDILTPEFFELQEGRDYIDGFPEQFKDIQLHNPYFVRNPYPTLQIDDDLFLPSMCIQRIHGALLNMVGFNLSLSQSNELFNQQSDEEVYLKCSASLEQHGFSVCEYSFNSVEDLLLIFQEGGVVIPNLTECGWNFPEFNRARYMYSHYAMLVNGFKHPVHGTRIFALDPSLRYFVDANGKPYLSKHRGFRWYTPEALELLWRDSNDTIDSPDGFTVQSKENSMWWLRWGLVVHPPADLTQSYNRKA